MIKCWEYEPEDRPSFEELHKSISSYVKRIAGYLDMSFYPTEEEGRNTTKEAEEEDEEVGEEEAMFGQGRVIQAYPPSLRKSHFGDGEKSTEL